MSARRLLKVAAVISSLAGGVAAAAVGLAEPAAAASEISVIVNKEPITTFAIRQREAFVKLRRVKGDPGKVATDELIEEALKKQEIRRRGIAIPDAAVDQAYGKFAADNKLTEAQLGEVLARAGFSSKAFKDYIRVQMGWGQAVQISMRSGGSRMSDQEVAQRMIEEGGKKPSTTEYKLQQVIFVIPAAKRAAMKGARMSEAAALGRRFQSCEANYDLAKTIRDVTVRELGRVTQLELPPAWKDAVVKISQSGVTPPQETDRGVEYIAVCSTRTVSDDKVAAMVFQTQDFQKAASGAGGPDQKLLKDLKDKAAIVRR